MTPAPDLQERLARHLAGTASEAEREQLERDALADDGLFDQLEALESELVDAYVRGELDEPTGRGVAGLLDVSTRMRAVADTTMALEMRGEQVPSADASEPASQATDRHRTTADHQTPAPRRDDEHPAEALAKPGPSMARAATGITVIVALLLTALAMLRTASLDRQVDALRQDLIRAEQENQQLRQQAITFDEEIARLRASHQDLTLRLTRLETQAAP